MDLLIDVGNSRIKWCWLNSGQLINFQALPHTKNLDADLFTAWSTLIKPDSILIGSVAAPTIVVTITAVIKKLWNSEPKLVQVQQDTYGVNVIYKDVSELGVDRWLAMIAARQRCKQAVVVADCGTAVTIDVLNDEGKHLGGLILPGLNLLKETIFENTIIAPSTTPLNFGMLGFNTGECIMAGALQAIAGAIELTYNRFTLTMDTRQLILTGGDANTVAKRLSIPYIIAPELVLEGLALLAT